MSRYFIVADGSVHELGPARGTAGRNVRGTNAGVAVRGAAPDLSVIDATGRQPPAQAPVRPGLFGAALDWFWGLGLERHEVGVGPRQRAFSGTGTGSGTAPPKAAVVSNSGRVRPEPGADAGSQTWSTIDATGSRMFSGPRTPNAPDWMSPELAALRARLARREGYRNDVYRDTLGFPSVGIGHRIVPADNLEPGDRIDDAQVEGFFAHDAPIALSKAREQASKAGISDESFLPALVSVNYQLGNGWTRKFPNTWALIKSGDYEGAAQLLDNSLWKRQTPDRVQDFQAALRALPAKR